jgi:predicted restriction endonuclease
MRYAELNANAPGYSVYRFLLSPAAPPPVRLQTPEQNVAIDFENDVSDAALPPDRVQRVREVIARNRSRVTQVKRRAGFRCARCGETASWETTQRVPYIEVHHIVALGEAGFDNVRNMIALCADCHRYLHLGYGREGEILRLRRSRGL